MRGPASAMTLMRRFGSSTPGSAPPTIERVDPGGAAEAAGLRAGDTLAAFAGVEPPDALAASWMIRLRVRGERVPLLFRRGGVAWRTEAVLGHRAGEGAFFRKTSFRLAVIPLSLVDLPREGTPDDAALDRMYFGEQPGSLRDYYRAQSGGAIDVTGKVLPTVEVPAKRAVGVKAGGTTRRPLVLQMDRGRILFLGMKGAS